MLAAVPPFAVGVADGAAVLARHTASEPAPPAAAAQRGAQASRTPDAEQRAETARTTAVEALLARRGHAVLHHDRAEWRSTLDPSHPGFVRKQMQAFDNLQEVRFAEWSYRLDTTHDQVPNGKMHRYDAPTWAPNDMRLDYRLRGFDKHPTDLAQYPTFVHRPQGWFLTSLTDFANRGQRSSLDLWDFGPVTTVRSHNVLVLGHPSSLALMNEVAAEVAADIPRVTAVWGPRWSQRAVVLVPSTQYELGRVVDDSGDLDHIAAVATAEVSLGAGKPDPVGDRVGINPANWPKLSPLGRRIVLTHELTHVATRAITSAATPSWLAEGFADYVGYLDSGVPTPFVAQDLGSVVRAGNGPRGLPQDQQFNGASKKLAQAYEGAWMACRLIALKYGQHALVRFYSAVGRSREVAPLAFANALQRVLHLSEHGFLTQWRSYVRTEMS